MVPAETAAQISCAAAENERNIDATRDCEPRTRAFFRSNGAQFVAAMKNSWTSGRKSDSGGIGFEVSPTPGDEAILIEAQSQLPHHSFEASGRFIVADE